MQDWYTQRNIKVADSNASNQMERALLKSLRTTFPKFVTQGMFGGNELLDLFDFPVLSRLCSNDTLACFVNVALPVLQREFLDRCIGSIVVPSFMCSANPGDTSRIFWLINFAYNRSHLLTVQVGFFSKTRKVSFKILSNGEE